MNIDLLEKEVCGVYSDCNVYSKAERNLNWTSGQFISVDNAIKIMELAVSSYNAFVPGLLMHLKRCNAEVCLAREASVCVYIKVPQRITDIAQLSEELLCDEFDEVRKIDNQFVYRIWWD